MENNVSEGVIIYTDDLVNFTYNKTILNCGSNENSFREE